MATTYSVETSGGVELKSGFRKLDTARKWASSYDGPFKDGRYMIFSIGKGRKQTYRGMVITPGMFLKECIWTPASNPKNLKYVINRDGSVTRK